MAGRLRALKAALWLACLTPLGLLARRALAGQLSANPIEFITLKTGFWALTLLLAALAVTPVRRLTGWNALIQLRRPLGLFAFFYATLHFLTYIVLDQFFAFGMIVDDIVKRPYITVGFAALVLLTPLALTSTRGWIRRLGRNWRRLHWLIYPAAALAVLHFYWKKSAKADVAEPLIFAGVLVVLLAVRLVLRVGRVSWRGKRGVV
jgi:methionine sulfoxide reductase heme-binding subunit